MSAEDFRYGLERYQTRLIQDPRAYTINFRNCLNFLVPEDDPSSMVPLAWALSATKENWESWTKAKKSSSATKLAEDAGLERVDQSHPMHTELWDISLGIVDKLTKDYLTSRQRGFSRHHSNPREAQENIFYLLGRAEPDALGKEVFDPKSRLEGAAYQITTNRYERCARLRKECIDYYRSINDLALVCLSCSFDFEDVYGELGAGFMHIHHIDPLGDLQEERLVDPKKDLVPLCPNCHTMVHRKLSSDQKPRSAEELAELRQR